MEQAGRGGRAARGRGRGGARRGRGRGRGRLDLAAPVPELAAVEQNEEVNLDFLNVPANLLNQNEEVDAANNLLSENYRDMHYLRNSISHCRDIYVHDKRSLQKEIDSSVEEYKRLRDEAMVLRNKIRKMEGPGIPFEEPDGFDVIP